MEPLRLRSDMGSADTLNAFLTLCGQASTSECAFSAGSAAATQQKWQLLLQRVRRNPVTVGNEQWNYDRLVTNTVTSLFHVPGWPMLACQLQQAWQDGVAACPPPTSPAVVAQASLASQRDAEVAASCPPQPP